MISCHSGSTVERGFSPTSCLMDMGWSLEFPLWAPVHLPEEWGGPVQAAVKSGCGCSSTRKPEKLRLHKSKTHFFSS